MVFLYLGDFDVHGLDIYLDYLFGSEMSVYEVQGNPTLIHIGLTLVDVKNFKNGKIQMGLKDAMKIEKILRRKCFDVLESINAT